MEGKKGIWKVSKGKGGRYYINCLDEEKVMHQEEITDTNGLGIYGYENLKDLAVSILIFEKEMNKKESILNA